MQGVHQDTVADAEEHVDTQAALWLLASLAGLYRQPFDAELVIKRFPPPIDLPTLIEALGALGLKAGFSHWPEAGLSALPLPAVALLSAPTAETTHTTSPEAESAASPQSSTCTPLTPALIVQHGDDTLAWVKPGQSAPETVALDVARAQAAPVLLLVAQAESPTAESRSWAESPEHPGCKCDTLSIGVSNIRKNRQHKLTAVDDCRSPDEVSSLNQTPPFRYVDGVLSEPSKTDCILGWVNFESADNRLYAPTLYGSFLLEALAQLSSVLLRRHTGMRRGGVLTGIERAEFSHEPPSRGSVLLMARVERSTFPHFTLICRARQGSRVLCSCTLNTRINDGVGH